MPSGVISVSLNIFIQRLRGFGGLAKIKFGGWLNSDERRRPPPAPLPGPAPALAPKPAPASAAPVAPKGVFQQTFKSFFVKSTATAEEKAAMQQLKEKQQKADLARLQQAKEERAQREANAHAHAQQA